MVHALYTLSNHHPVTNSTEDQNPLEIGCVLQDILVDHQLTAKDRCHTTPVFFFLFQIPANLPRQRLYRPVKHKAQAEGILVSIDGKHL